jgi:hypothetical protein
LTDKNAGGKFIKICLQKNFMFNLLIREVTLMSQHSINQKSDEERFSAALDWYFDNKPYGSKTALSELLGKTKGFVSAVISKNIVNPEARRLISAGIGVPLEVMLEVGRRILEGQHPGPSLPDFPRTRPNGKPLKPGALATSKPWLPKSDLPPTMSAENFIAVAPIDSGVFKVPLSQDMRLVPDVQSIYHFPVDAPVEESTIFIGKKMFPGINQKNIHAVTMTETVMEPLIFKDDVLIVDTERSKGCDLRCGPIYMIKTELDGVVSAVPRFISFSKYKNLIIVFAPDNLEWTPEITDSLEIEVLGTVILIMRPFQGFENRSLASAYMKRTRRDKRTRED